MKKRSDLHHFSRSFKSFYVLIWCK